MTHLHASVSAHNSGTQQQHRSAPVAAEALQVVALPDRAPARAALRVQVALALEAAVLAARRRDAPHLTVLVRGVADPVDARVLHKHDGVASRSLHGERDAPRPAVLVRGVTGPVDARVMHRKASTERTSCIA